MSELPSYELLRELSPGRTWLVADSYARLLVLKTLSPDCLTQAGDLHPSIKIRLTRLRELPLGGFVNILGVERHATLGTVIVSQFVDGRLWQDVSDMDRLRLGRELKALVVAVHQFGMVHGALHGRNVVVDGAEKLILIDPSPLLYDDPKTDLDALAALTSAHGPSHDKPVAAAVIKETDKPARQRMLAAAVALGVAAVIGAVAAAKFLTHQ